MTVTINGTSGITLPSGSSAVGTTDSQTLTNKTIGSGYSGSTVTSGTAVASTSGTSIDFTSIPSWVKRITVMFNGVSTNGTSKVIIQIGSGSVVATGYVGSVGNVTNAGATTASNFSTGFTLDDISNASGVRYGTAVLSNVTSNTWVESATIGRSDSTGASFGGGSLALSGTLDRVRITTVNGTDTFDAGSINILYE